MTEIKVLAFDVGGSVFDWKSAVSAAVAGLPDGAVERTTPEKVDPADLAMRWRRRMFVTLQGVHRGELPHTGMDAILDLALDDVLADLEITRLDPAARARLHRSWHEMPVWAEFPDALRRLRTRYRVAILSILGYRMLVDCSKAGGLVWDAVLSCEFLSAYKTKPAAYREGAELLGCTPEEICFVAVHPVDLDAAAAVGTRTAFVTPKMDEPDIPGMNPATPRTAYDHVADSYAQLCDRLGC